MESDWPKQSDPEIKETNIILLLKAMDLLYETHITEHSTAIHRGGAIQAINRMLIDLGHTSGIQDAERIPHSKRLRESEIWNEKERGEDE